MLSQKNKKKSIILALTGAFALSAFSLPFMQNVSAAASEPAMTMHHREHPGAADLQIDDLADQLGISREELKTSLANGTRIQDLHMAALIAETSQQSWKDVLASKTAANSWKDVCVQYKVSREDLRKTMEKHMAKRMASKLSLDEQTVSTLLSNGYRPHDIIFASVLSQKTDKDIQSILDMKKINNRWEDVAMDLGLSADDLQKCREDIRTIMPMPPFERMHEGESSHADFQNRMGAAPME